MTHTPGPWRVDWSRNGHEAEIATAIPPFDENGNFNDGYRHITNNCPLGASPGEPRNSKGISLQAIADLNLMAAAPDMYDALVYVKNCIAGHDDWWIGEFCNEIDEAIAKAEGR